MLISEITFVAIVGILTVTVGVLVKAIGFPDQFRKNHQRKSTRGLSTIFILLSVVSYSLWTLYGFLQGDWVVIIGQGAGIFVSGAILFQIFYYRGRG